jgi:hypothetical protein
MEMTDAAQPGTTEYADFRILVDEPAESPALGFAEYADAFGEIVSGSPPRFAIGIFGGWGSGKTTLMRAIESRIEHRDEVIPVWFNAWRYEREPQLIIPLLDVLRETLLAWAEDHRQDSETERTVADRARKAAAAIGAAARAIAKGISLSARLPGGVVEAKVDLKEMLAWDAALEAVDEPASIYHAGFRAMAKAVRDFITAGAEPGPARDRDGASQSKPQRRIVVFVDDLDRCLPLNALSVLESMKLFFDLDGFVFVAGLDQSVIERAIDLRYTDRSFGTQAAATASADGKAGDAASRFRPPGAISGRDYIKKIFQVPFGLPPVDRSQLEELVTVLVGVYGLSSEQRAELQGRILEHLQYYTDERGGDAQGVGARGINAREVKRLINAYTLQTKILSKRMDTVEPDTILALQVIAFRPDWARIRERLEADPDSFASRLVRDEDTVWVDGQPLPPRLADYLEKGPGKSLLTNQRLKAYVSSSEASHSSDPTLLNAQAVVDDLRRFMHDVDDHTDRSRLSRKLYDRLDAWTGTVSGAQWATDLQPIVSRLQSQASLLASPEGDDPPIGEWSDAFKARLDRLDHELRVRRDQYSFLSS